MHLSVKNFLTHIKDIVTGGGVDSGGQAVLDGGYLHDMNFSLADILAADSSGDSFSAFLGITGNFQTLAGAGITNSGPTTIQGNVGVGPGAPTVTGFPPGIILGTIDAGAAATAAQAYLSSTVVPALNGQGSYTSIAAELGGTTLTPGNYTGGASTLTAGSGPLTLNGAGTYIFKLGAFTISNAATIVLTGGATANNVYFTSTSAITVGTTASLYGNFIAATTMTFNTGATLVGRAFGQSAAVTFLSNVLTLPGGTNGTVPASAFKSVITIPFRDTDLANGQTWKVTMPFAGSVTAVGVRTGLPGTGAGATATLTTQINGVATTGGVITMSLASQTTTGVLTPGTSITGANTFTAGQTLEFAVSAVTAFTTGSAQVEFTVLNSDAQLAAASTQAAVVTSETHLRAASFAAGTTTAGTITFVIPRDYDEATDTLTLKVGVAMTGTTNVPGLSVTAYRKRPGEAIATVGTATGKLLGQTNSAAAPLSDTEQVLYFNLSRHGLLRDDAMTLVITTDAHTTDDLLVYFVEPVYRSTLVSYDPTDGVNSMHGTSLR